MADNKNAQTRVATVLHRMSEMVAEDARYAELFAHDLSTMLDMIQANKGFGEKGEDDPRGNATQGSFSLNHVEGVDDACPHGNPTTHDCELRIQHGVCAGCGRQAVYPK